MTPLAEAQPGDIVLFHNKGMIPWLIRFGQWIRRRGPWDEWNHAAIIVDPAKGSIYQAEARGVIYIDDALEGESNFEIFPLGGFPTFDGLTIDPVKVLAFAKAQVGDRYSFLTIASIIVNLLTPRFLHLDFRKDRTYICSGLVACALWAGGAYLVSDPFAFMPSEIAQVGTGTRL